MDSIQNKTKSFDGDDIVLFGTLELTFLHDIVLMHTLIDPQLLDHELIDNDVMNKQKKKNCR